MTELRENYRTYLLISRVYKNQPVGIVLDADGKQVTVINAETIEEAMQETKAFVDIEIRNRRAERGGRMATASEYKQAFKVLVKNGYLQSYHEDMLRAHCRAPDQTSSMRELATAAGNSSFRFANRFYGGLGGEIADILGLELKTRKDGTVIRHLGIATPADGQDKDENSDEYKLQMRPEVLEALRSLELV